MQKEFDFIVVGAGSAGCVVATSLLEQTNSTVLLLEAGPLDNSMYIHMPAGLPNAMAKFTWKYETEPEAHANNRRIDIPQGKVLGGGSSVNGMAYVRGVQQDYDDWVNIYGCQGWSYQEVLDSFVATENNESLAGKYHGNDGYLSVSENRYRHPISQAFLRSAQELGYDYLTDLNGKEDCGVSFYQTTTNKGKRASTVDCFLNRVRDNPRLTLLTDCVTEKIVFEGKKAIGVQYQNKKGESIFVKVNKEIILSAGAFGSPKILMLSGVGPKQHLQDIGINLVHDSAMVGKNLQDHLHVNISASLKQPISILKQTQGLSKISAGLNWLMFKGGVCGSNILESGGFFDLDGDGRRDTQIHTFPLIENFGNKDSVAQEAIEGFSLKLGHLYPQSRGEVLLRSNSVHDLPVIKANYLSDPGDLKAMVTAVKFGFKFFDTLVFKKIMVERVFPTKQEITSDEDIENFVRENAKTVFHPTSTCCMGGDPEKSVLDAELKVRGVEGVRVIDASAFPHIPSGNTNAPVIMLAHRATSFIINNYK